MGEPNEMHPLDKLMYGERRSGGVNRAPKKERNSFSDPFSHLDTILLTFDKLKPLYREVNRWLRF